jgi:uncharacterized protein YprB with RNaseH-like and TPR domain
MTEDLHAQLELLRARMASAALETGLRLAETKARGSAALCEAVPGREVRTAAGCHWEAEKVFGYHGSRNMTDLADLPHNLMDGIANGEIPASHPESWAFLDTETTGLAGGSGTCAFLIGVGRITPTGFRVRQYFMRDFDEEASALAALEEDLAGAETLVTYNGKTFDLPLLETRFRMSRRKPPFAKLPHLDLLHGARRLWRLRYESCKLTALESEVLGMEREGDVPGFLIPPIYFDFVRNGLADRLAPVFHHNALDIVSLACLTSIVPWAFRDPLEANLTHGGEMISLGRWLLRMKKDEEALEMFKRGVAKNIPTELEARTLVDIGKIERRIARREKKKNLGGAGGHLFHTVSLVD